MASKEPPEAATWWPPPSSAALGTRGAGRRREPRARSPGASPGFREALNRPALQSSTRRLREQEDPDPDPSAWARSRDGIVREMEELILHMGRGLQEELSYWGASIKEELHRSSHRGSQAMTAPVKNFGRIKFDDPDEDATDVHGHTPWWRDELRVHAARAAPGTAATHLTVPAPAGHRAGRGASPLRGGDLGSEKDTPPVAPLTLHVPEPVGCPAELDGSNSANSAVAGGPGAGGAAMLGESHADEAAGRVTIQSMQRPEVISHRLSADADSLRPFEGSKAGSSAVIQNTSSHLAKVMNDVKHKGSGVPPHREDDGRVLASCKRMLSSRNFDNFVGVVILLNAAMIGAQTNHGAELTTEEVPLGFFILEQLFCAWFLFELILRIFVHRLRYFHPYSEGVLWNYFDFLLVVSQVMELLLDIIARLSKVDKYDMKLLNALRVLRLVRILRVIRVLHLISELRAIISSIAGSFKSLVWVVCLLFIVIYIVAVYFTQSVTAHFVQRAKEAPTAPLDEDQAALKMFFSSIPRAILTLWQAMSGGHDWDTIAAPLQSNVGVLAGFLFASYIAFALLCLLNVVTGVFVQTALQSARKEEDRFMKTQIYSIFGNDTCARRISQAEVQDSVTDPRCAKEWKSIGVEPDDVCLLFHLLDLHDTGEVPLEEFLGGCLRLSSDAKGLDLLTMMQEARKEHIQTRQAYRELFLYLEDLRSISLRSLHSSGDGTNRDARLASLMAQIEASQRDMVETHKSIRASVCKLEKCLPVLSALESVLSPKDDLSAPTSEDNLV